MSNVPSNHLDPDELPATHKLWQHIVAVVSRRVNNEEGFVLTARYMGTPAGTAWWASLEFDESVPYTLAVKSRLEAIGIVFLSDRR
jgi:hypothetical protein